MDSKKWIDTDEVLQPASMVEQNDEMEHEKKKNSNSWMCRYVTFNHYQMSDQGEKEVKAYFADNKEKPWDFYKERSFIENLFSISSLPLHP